MDEQQILDEDKRIALNNKIQSRMLKLKKALDDERHIIMQVVSPLDVQETSLQRKLESIGRERMLIQAYTQAIQESKVVDINIEEIKKMYFELCYQLREDFISGYIERMKSREYFFDSTQNKFIKIDRSKFPQMIEQFTIEIDIELAIHQERFMKFLPSLNSVPGLAEYEAMLGKQVDEFNQKLDDLVEQKMPHGMQYNDAESNFLQRRQKLLSIKDEYDQSIETSLPELCFNGNLSEIKILIQNNKNIVNQINKLGDLPLHRACEGGHREVVEFLLLNNANPALIDQNPKKGFTAYHSACMQNNMQIFALLFPRGQNEGLKVLSQKGRTVLHCAVFSNNLPVMACLTNKEINLNAKDTFMGSTALHIAAWKGYDKAAEHLILCGASVNITDNNGDTPVFTALLYRQTAVLKVFLKHGYCLSQQEMSKIFGDNKQFPSASRRLFALCLEEANLEHSEMYRKAIAVENQPVSIDSVTTSILPQGNYNPTIFVNDSQILTSLPVSLPTSVDSHVSNNNGVQQKK